MSEKLPDYCDIEIDNKNILNKFVDFIKINKLDTIYLSLLILLIILLYLLIININPFNLVNINFSLFILFTLIFLVLLSYLIKIYKLNFNIFKFILIILFIVSIYIFLNYIYLLMKKSLSSNIISLINKIIIITIVILLLVKFHKKIFNFLNNIIIINIISIFNKVKTFLYDIYSKNNLSFKLILFSLLLLFISFIPTFYNFIVSSMNGSNTLLKEPIYLNKEYTINMNKYINLTNPNYHYSISFWYWLNPQPPNTSYSYNKYTNILNYGDTPSIEINPLKNKFRIKYKKNINNDEIIYESKIISYQKWNNIFINFDGGNMDIFLNGKLVSSKPNIISEIKYNNLILGEKNGIHGGISNVVYYNKNIDSNTIENNYNSFKNNMNPYF